MYTIFKNVFTERSLEKGSQDPSWKLFKTSLQKNYHIHWDKRTKPFLTNKLPWALIWVNP